MWVVGGGRESQRASVVATDGTVGDAPCTETNEALGGFACLRVKGASATADAARARQGDAEPGGSMNP